MAQFLINPIIQTELIHLCAGPSGAGKTRWLITTLQNIWRRGHDVLGHRSYPVPWCYVPMDRSMKSVEQMFLTLDIDPDLIKIIPAVDANITSINEIFDAAESLGARLIVIEMFSYLLGGPQTSDTVRSFMGACQRALALRRAPMTIIGTMESPKMKPHDLYKNPRQRISGPASWGHCAETVILVEPDPKLPDDSPKRVIRILPRNGPAEIFHMEFHSDGKLHPQRRPAGKSASLDDVD